MGDGVAGCVGEEAEQESPAARAREGAHEPSGGDVKGDDHAGRIAAAAFV